MRILIGLMEHLGDIVACEPVVRYLKSKHPGAHITWTVSAPFRELIDSNPNIDETLVLECLTDWIKLTKHNTYDLIVDLHVNYRICQHCGVPLVKEKGNPFVSVYEWFDYGTLLEAFSVGAGLPALAAQPNLYLTDAHRQAVDKLNLPKEFCVVHPSSNNIVKDWRPEAWKELSRWIKEDLGLPIVEVGAGKPGTQSPLPNPISLFNKLSILETAEVIRRGRLFIGIDSGPAHLANAVMTPSVIMLGRHFQFRQYMPFNGFLARNIPQVKIVRNLIGSVSDLSIGEIKEAVRYVHAAGDVDRATLMPQHDEFEIKPPQTPIITKSPTHGADRKAIVKSQLFDERWYLLRYPEVQATGLDPLDHFIMYGAIERRSPSELFDAEWYLQANPDVASSGGNPLLHYIHFGEMEGRIRRAVQKSEDNGSQKAPSKDNKPIPPQEAFAAANFGSSDLFPQKAADSNAYPRMFAFYLPQYHPIPENDWAHGPGFTEWNNVIKAKPLFKGHYQPRVPGELGFYDLRSLDVFREQVELAQQHGISGFCFYYYYFKGKKLLYQPIQQFIDSDIDMPFFFLWANENWTKRWDGGNNEVIIAQEHSKEDDLAFLLELLPLFEDPRYVKIEGRPLLLIYKQHLFPNIHATIELWRTEIEKRGYPGIYLVMVDDWAQNFNHPRDFGFDASYEIPSNIMPPQVQVDDLQAYDLKDDFCGKVIDYTKFANYHMARPFPAYKRFRTVMLPWDNTARYGSRAIVHVNGQGDAYKLWLMQALFDTYRRYAPDERIVFLHSWNEWCEGTYLEPDGKFGRFFLEQTSNASKVIREAIDLCQNVPDATGVMTELLKVMHAKDEGTYRLMQATRIQTGQAWRELEAARNALLAMESANAAKAPNLGTIFSRIGRLFGRA